MVGWAKLRTRQEMTPCPYNLVLEISYYAMLQKTFRVFLDFMLTLDCHLRLREQTSTSKCTEGLEWSLQNLSVLEIPLLVIRVPAAWRYVRLFAGQATSGLVPTA